MTWFALRKVIGMHVRVRFQFILLSASSSAAKPRVLLDE